MVWKSFFLPFIRGPFYLGHSIFAGKIDDKGFGRDFCGQNRSWSVYLQKLGGLGRRGWMGKRFENPHFPPLSQFFVLRGQVTAIPAAVNCDGLSRPPVCSEVFSRRHFFAKPGKETVAIHKPNYCPCHIRWFHTSHRTQEVFNRTHLTDPNKPEYLIARSQLTEQGPLVRSHLILDGQIIWIYTFKLKNTKMMHPTFFFKLEHACMTCAIVFAYSLDRNPELQPVLHKKRSLVLTYESPRRVAFVKEEKALNMPIYKIYDSWWIFIWLMGSSVFKFIFVTLIFSVCDFSPSRIFGSGAQDSIQFFKVGFFFGFGVHPKTDVSSCEWKKPVAGSLWQEFHELGGRLGSWLSLLDQFWH